MKRNDKRSRRGSNSKSFDRRSRYEPNSGGSDLRSFERGSFHSSNREMHKAVCAECKTECKVPFKPREGRPVYCRECYDKHRPQRF